MLLAGFLLAGSVRAAEDVDLLEEEAIQAAVARVAPSVVRIETVGGLEQVGEVLFGTGPTTGLIVGANGHIISSAFNFIHQPSSILVQLPDGTRKPARRVATDHNRLLTLLKIDVEQPLPVPSFAPKDRMRVGQWAIGVGRAFEIDRPNISVGILSAVNRIWGRAVQTDAAVSPTNYGGPLVDVRGDVLGLLVPLSPEGNDEVAGVEWYDSGIGFAIPAEDVQQAFLRLKEGKDLHPGVLGIGFASDNLHLSEPEIASVRPNSPAQKAGLQKGDKIVEAAGRKTSRAVEVKEEVSKRYAGDTLRLVVLRGNERIEADVQLVDRLEPYATPFLGILPMRPTVAKADERPQDQPAKPQGVRVRYVYPQSPAAQAGIKPGDLVVALAGKAVRDAAEMRRKISDSSPGTQVELEIRRGEKTFKQTATLDRLPEELPNEPLPPALAPVESKDGERPQVGKVQFQLGESTNQVWAYIPEAYDPAVPHGLVVWLHGEGGFDVDELIAQWKTHCDRDHLILVAPQASNPDRWTLKELSLVRGLLTQLQSRYTIDPTRIVAFGRQEGGKLAYLLAFTEREAVRAVATVHAPLVGRPPENDPQYRLAFYMAWAAKGESAGEIEEVVDRLRQMNYPVSVRDLGEKPRPLSDEERLQLARWIDTLDRI